MVDRVNPKEIRVTALHPGIVELERVAGVQPGADIAVFSLTGDLTPDLDLTPTIDGIVWGQDAYFLGFPFGIGFDLGGGSLPFVKKAIVSGLYKSINGVSLVLLDGINNPGFSGGPVVFCKMGTKELVCCRGCQRGTGLMRSPYWVVPGLSPQTQGSLSLTKYITPSRP